MLRACSPYVMFSIFTGLQPVLLKVVLSGLVQFKRNRGNSPTCNSAGYNPVSDVKVVISKLDRFKRNRGNAPCNNIGCIPVYIVEVIFWNWFNKKRNRATPRHVTAQGETLRKSEWNRVKIG